MRLKNSLNLYKLFNFTHSFDLYAAIKVIIFYQLTHSYSAAAGLISITLIATALSEIPTGVFSDMVGRKRTIILGSFCFLLAYTLFALGMDYWVLAFGAVIEGVGLSFFSGNNNAYLHNLLSDEDKQNEYHHHFGKVMSITTFASVAGVFIGGWIATFSIFLALWLNIIPRLISFILAIFLKDIEQEEHVDTNVFSHLKDALSEIRHNLTLRYASLSSILGGSGFAAGELQAAAFAIVWPTWAVGVAKGIQSVAGIPGYYYAGKLIDKFGSVKIMALGTILSVLGNIGTGLVRTIISPIFVMLSLPLYGPSDAAEQRILQKEFTEKQRATIASINSLGNSITAGIALYVCGLIANQYGPFIALLATQVLLIPSLFYQFLFLKRVNKEYPKI